MISFLIPIRTVSALNKHELPMERHGRIKRERAATLRAYRRSIPREIQPLLIVVLTRIGRRKLDKGDNLASSMKGVRDQVACILGVDDGGPLVDWRYGPQEIGDYAVRVEVFKAGEQPQRLAPPKPIKTFESRLSPNVIRERR